MAIKETSPANKRIDVSDKTRIPMNNAEQKLSVPEIPGYNLHWMMGTPSRIEQALRSGYTFVEHEETDLKNLDLAGDARHSGNSDLGTRVSMLASPVGGNLGDDGQPLRLYLMKLPLEWHKEDQRKHEERELKFREAITHGAVGTENMASKDLANRYVKQADFSFRR